VREVPIERILFGSDAPLVDARLELHKVRLLKLPKEQERQVLGGNAARLLGLR
jgi:predicted TIM-barrel fold metal-dependent hydrolase